MATTLPHVPVVLIVEDEPLLRVTAVDLLEDEGFATMEADCAEAALVQLEAHPEISVLFTDINMPGAYDGLELARRVHMRRPDVQLILTSGRHPPAAQDIPDDGTFVAKPYQARAVAALIRAADRRA
jgi:CheY-like chemotaxis protein